MSSFYKKNPLINKVISNDFFKVDVPKNIRLEFIKSLTAAGLLEKANAEEMTEIIKYENGSDEVKMDIADIEDNNAISEECPLFMISKNIQKAADQLDIKKVADIFDLQELPFQRAIFCLGSDVDGMYYMQRHQYEGITYLSFTFLFGSTQADFNKKRALGTIMSLPLTFASSKVMSLDYRITLRLARLLVYMYYGDIITKKYGKKDKIATNTRGTIVNTTDYDITYVNTLWKQRVSTTGFLVKGHWRLQPFGKRDKVEHRLLWIESFEKSGYNRKATKELINN